MKVDKTIINTLNKKNVLNIINAISRIFKVEIARMADLSIPTVMKITDDLIERGLVRDVGKGESSGGKPPAMLEFVPDAYYIIGVDIGTTNIVSIIMDMAANIVNKQLVSTQVKDTSENIINRIIGTIEKVILNSGVPREKILGIGIGMPGLLDLKSGKVLFSPDFKWENIDIVSPLKEKFDMPIIIENVTRAMAMGEKWFGLANELNNFLCINLGYGIGSAIFMNGELYRGGSGSSGEFGHMAMEKNGPECDCGNFGCLEALASGNAIKKKAIFYLEKGERSLINSEKPMDALEAKDVFEAAKKNDPLATEIVRQAAEYLGIAFANVINFIDPQLIILEGGVSRAGGIFLDTIRNVVNRRQMKYAGKHMKILVSDLGEDSAAIGAASFFINRIFETGGDRSLI